MNRRDLITLLGGAAVWPMSAHGQQRPMPVIGVLTPGYRPSSAPLEAAFRQGLGETGFVEGRNVSIEYRWAEGQFERIPALAADLVQRRLAVIFAAGPPAVRALKTLTTTIPVVFSMGEDPVRESLVANLNRPGGNITGFSYFANLLFAKRLGLLHECVLKKDAAFGFLVNPENPNAEPDTKDLQIAANGLGRQLHVFGAKTEREFGPAFEDMARLRVGGLCVNIDLLFLNRREQ